MRDDHNLDLESLTETERAGSGKQRKTPIATGDRGRLRTVIGHKSRAFRLALPVMLESRIQLVWDTHDGLEAVEKVQLLRPELVLMDIDLDGMHGTQACREMIKHVPDLLVIVITDSYRAILNRSNVVRAGARALCLKSSGPGVYIEAVKQAAAGFQYVDPLIAALLDHPPLGLPPDLTDRQFEIFIRLDLSDDQILQELNMRRRTLELQIQDIIRKLRVRTRGDAIAMASEAKTALSAEK